MMERGATKLQIGDGSWGGQEENKKEKGKKNKVRGEMF